MICTSKVGSVQKHLTLFFYVIFRIFDYLALSQTDTFAFLFVQYFPQDA